MARGKAPRLSNPPTILPDGSWTELLETGGRGRLAGGIWDGWISVAGGLQGCTG